MYSEKYFPYSTPFFTRVQSLEVPTITNVLYLLTEMSYILINNEWECLILEVLLIILNNQYCTDTNQSEWALALALVRVWSLLVITLAQDQHVDKWGMLGWGLIRHYTSSVPLGMCWLKRIVKRESNGIGRGVIKVYVMHFTVFPEQTFFFW